MNKYFNEQMNMNACMPVFNPFKSRYVLWLSIALTQQAWMKVKDGPFSFTPLLLSWCHGEQRAGRECERGDGPGKLSLQLHAQRAAPSLASDAIE